MGHDVGEGLRPTSQCPGQVAVAEAEGWASA